MSRLSQKNHWDQVHETSSFTFSGWLNKLTIFRFFSLGFSNWELYHLIGKHMRETDKEIFEVGCAPGNYLVKFAQMFGCHPNGIEYSDSGVQVLAENFEKNDIEAHIIHGDFFDESFAQENRESYDLVYSLGFIEHFEDPKDVVERHFSLTKKGGMVALVIPNLRHLGEYLTEKHILDIHNQKIMDREVFRGLFPQCDILEARYFGGIFNIGLFFYKNPILEKIRFVFFLLQRFIVDPISLVLYKLGINLANRYTSPSIIVIARKI